MEGKGTVLIVDDNPADRALFRTILTRGGYTVFEVSRGIGGGRQGDRDPSAHHRAGRESART